MEKFEGSYKKSFTNEANIHRAINMYQLSLIITTDIQPVHVSWSYENCKCNSYEIAISPVHDLNHL